MEHRPALEKIAEALLEHETIDGKHVMEILQFGEIRSPILPSIPKSDARPMEKKVSEKPEAPVDAIPEGSAPAPHPA